MAEGKERKTREKRVKSEEGSAFNLGCNITCSKVSVGSGLWGGMWFPWQQMSPMCDIPEYGAYLPSRFLMLTVRSLGLELQKVVSYLVGARN